MLSYAFQVPRVEECDIPAFTEYCACWGDKCWKERHFCNGLIFSDFRGDGENTNFFPSDRVFWSRVEKCRGSGQEGKFRGSGKRGISEEV